MKIFCKNFIKRLHYRKELRERKRETERERQTDRQKEREERERESFSKCSSPLYFLFFFLLIFNFCGWLYVKDFGCIFFPCPSTVKYTNPYAHICMFLYSKMDSGSSFCNAQMLLETGFYVRIKSFQCRNHWKASLYTHKSYKWIVYCICMIYMNTNI